MDGRHGDDFIAAVVGVRRDRFLQRHAVLRRDEGEMLFNIGIEQLAFRLVGLAVDAQDAERRRETACTAFVRGGHAEGFAAGGILFDDVHVLVAIDGADEFFIVKHDIA